MLVMEIGIRLLGIGIPVAILIWCLRRLAAPPSPQPLSAPPFVQRARPAFRKFVPV